MIYWEGGSPYRPRLVEVRAPLNKPEIIEFIVHVTATSPWAYLVREKQHCDEEVDHQRYLEEVFRGNGIVVEPSISSTGPNRRDRSSIHSLPNASGFCLEQNSCARMIRRSSHRFWNGSPCRRFEGCRRSPPTWISSWHCNKDDAKRGTTY